MPSVGDPAVRRQPTHHAVRLPMPSRSASFLVAALILMVAVLRAQPSQPIRTLYVDTFQGGPGSADLRKLVAERLRAQHKWQLVNQPSAADAIVHGSGEFWIKGHLTNSARAAAGQVESVYGGYLSLEVQSRSGQILWSYLVTPGRLHWSGVPQDMADHMVRLMAAALARSAAPGVEATTAPAAQVTLAGAGSTFAAPLYQDWVESFGERHPEVRITYQAVGSEEGIRLLQQGKVDFAASDVPLSDQQMESTHVRFENVATVLGGVVPAYNLPGIGRDLRFTPELLAQIYLGKIARWNDPRLRSVNRGARLPDQPITVAHRSDGSGTSFAWTAFLSATSPEWKAAVGAGMRVRWPAGEAAPGNDGVAVKVAATPGAIGYVELTYAIRHELSYGLVRNAAGKFVQANLTTLSAAARAAPHAADLRASLLDAPGNNAYPITTFTWIVVPVSAENPQKQAALRDLLRWMLTSGQRECAGLGYLPLPKEVADRELRQAADHGPGSHTSQIAAASGLAAH